MTDFVLKDPGHHQLFVKLAGSMYFIFSINRNWGENFIRLLLLGLMGWRLRSWMGLRLSICMGGMMVGGMSRRRNSF